MFSYTDDAIVTSSPTGRHLSTVIRHPAGMPDDQWRKHADQVCTVLNELDRASKCKEMRLALSYAEGPAGLQAYGRSVVPAELRSSGPYMADLERRFGLEPDQRAAEPTLASARIAELEKQLDGANARLECDRLVELSDLQLRQAWAMSPGSTMSIESQRVIIKRVE